MNTNTFAMYSNTNTFPLLQKYSNMNTNTLKGVFEYLWIRIRIQIAQACYLVVNPSWKFDVNFSIGLVYWTPTRLKTPKTLKCCHSTSCCRIPKNLKKALPWKQLWMDIPSNLSSSRSFSGKHFLKIWLKSLHGFDLRNTCKLNAHRRHRRCPDSTG